MAQDESLIVGLKRGPTIAQQAYGGPTDADQIDAAREVEKSEEERNADPICVQAEKNRTHRLADCRQGHQTEKKSKNSASTARRNAQLRPWPWWLWLWC